MNILKVTKWEGFTLFCLVTLSILLALAGLWAAQGFQARFSQVNPIQSEGKPMDVIMTGQKLAETAHNTLMGLGKYHLMGGARTPDPTGASRCQFASESSVADPVNGGHFILAGYARKVDNTGRI